jgi:hypothetical protein
MLARILAIMVSWFYAGKFLDSISVRPLPLPSRSFPFHYITTIRRRIVWDTVSVVK